MTIRLSGAQVTLVQEAISRAEDKDAGYWIPEKTVIEELVEGILKIVLPETTVSTAARDPWEQPGPNPDEP